MNTCFYEIAEWLSLNRLVCGKNIFADPVTGGRTKPRHWEATAVSRPILLNSEQFAHIHDQPIVPTPNRSSPGSGFQPFGFGLSACLSQ